MCFEIKNVKRVVLICPTHGQLSTILCSEKLSKLLWFSTTVVDKGPKHFKIESCEWQTWAKKKNIEILKRSGQNGWKFDSN